MVYHGLRQAEYNAGAASDLIASPKPPAHPTVPPIALAPRVRPVLGFPTAAHAPAFSQAGGVENSPYTGISSWACTPALPESTDCLAAGETAQEHRSLGDSKSAGLNYRPVASVEPHIAHVAARSADGAGGAAQRPGARGSDLRPTTAASLVARGPTLGARPCAARPAELWAWPTGEACNLGRPAGQEDSERTLGTGPRPLVLDRRAAVPILKDRGGLPASAVPQVRAPGQAVRDGRDPCVVAAHVRWSPGIGEEDGGPAPFSSPVSGGATSGAGVNGPAIVAAEGVAASWTAARVAGAWAARECCAAEVEVLHKRLATTGHLLESEMRVADPPPSPLFLGLRRFHRVCVTFFTSSRSQDHFLPWPFLAHSQLDRGLSRPSSPALPGRCGPSPLFSWGRCLPDIRMAHAVESTASKLTLRWGIGNGGLPRRGRPSGRRCEEGLRRKFGRCVLMWRQCPRLPTLLTRAS